MQKPLHHWFFFWFGPAVFLVLGLVVADSYFNETSLRIPRGASRVPAFLYVEGGLLHLDLEETPDPHVENTFAFRRNPAKERRLQVWGTVYQKVDAFKYQGTTAEDRKAAKAAGIRSPLVAHEFALPLLLLMALVATVWWLVVRRRSKRMAREAMESGTKAAA